MLPATILSTGDGGVEHPQTPIRALNGHSPRNLGQDRGEVDDQTPLRGVVEHPARTGKHEFDVRRVRDHGGNDIGVVDGLGDAGGPPASRLDQCRDRLRAAVEADHVEAGAHEIARHRAAHDSQPDERDLRDRATTHGETPSSRRGNLVPLCETFGSLCGPVDLAKATASTKSAGVYDAVMQ
jgi:hypothetical protein